MAARQRGPRAHVHHGTVAVAALWFDLALLGEAEARARVLAAWTPGTAVYAVAGGLLLRLPAPRRMACAAAPGLPFTLEEDALFSAPLTPAERERLAPSRGSAVLIRAGQVEVHPLDEAQRVDVSAWLEVSTWTLVPVEGLGAPLPPVPALTPVEAPTRARFGPGIPALAPEAERMLARMEEREVPPAPRPGLLARFRAWLRGGRAGQAVPAQSAASSAATGGLGVRSLLARVLARLGGARPERAPSGRRAPDPAPAPPRPAGPGLLGRLTAWALRETPLGSVVGRRKAEYVRRLFNLFEEGNLDEALRYAIPLGGDAPTEQARVALGLPGPRESLAIQPGHGGPSSLFAGGVEVFAALKERYRAAFRRLEREGRIEEAAFILAELLREHEEAVSFLERHGRLRLAAELAEGRGLAPGLVVRQWLLAKDVARAVAIARRTGAFADAVLRLERTHPDEARTLRLLWGEVLAEAGDYARAVDVVWPVNTARRLALSWLERGIEEGGVRGARLLASKALAFPERFEEVRARALALLDEEGADGAAARYVFTEALCREREHAQAQVRTALLRPALRAFLRDRSAGHPPLGGVELKRILEVMGDPVLQADLPALPPPPALGFQGGDSPPRYRFGAGEGAPWAVHDAVPLEGGRLLVALGEAGARLVSREGRCLAHFDVPAFSLVLSGHRDRALALAPRGELQRISRLDLAGRRAATWCDARVDAFAPRYDGNLWFIAVEDTVMALDALAPEARALWRVPEVGGRVMAVAVAAGALSFVLVREEGELERWGYALPGPTLRARSLLRAGPGPLLHLSLRPEGEVVALDLVLAHPAEPGPPLVHTSPRWIGSHLGRAARGSWLQALPDAVRTWLVLGGTHMASLERTLEGCEVQLLGPPAGAPSARFLFEGEHLVRARFTGRELLLFDAAGRLVRVELLRGTVQRVLLG